MSHAFFSSSREPLLLRVFGDSDDKRSSDSPRLPDLLADWYVPLILKPEGASEETITSYWESVEWWVRLTSNPPIREITPTTLAEFRTSLKTATWRRGRYGTLRTLAPRTVRKHERQLATILWRVGPGDDEREGASILDAPIKLKVSAVPKSRPKPHFTLAEVMQILAAAPRMPRPRRPLIDPWTIPMGLWWVAFTSMLFYTGLRTGTVRRLTWSMLVDDPDGARYGHPGAWLKIPGAIVKTGGDIDKFLHPAALTALQRVRGKGRAEDLILPWPHHRRHISDRHKHLQRLAGIPVYRLLSPHAWRRTHADQLSRLGIKHAQAIAQRSLDHADAATTREFYTDVEPQLISQLPWILPAIGPHQRELF